LPASSKVGFPVITRSPKEPCLHGPYDFHPQNGSASLC
jgi:hypothetical protein